MRRSFPVLAVTAVGAGVAGGTVGAVLALKAVANAIEHTQGELLRALRDARGK